MFNNSEFNAIGIIPARLESSRLPRKPLLDIAGKPLIQYVWENAVKAESLDTVLISADSDEICNLCEKFGAECIVTPSSLVTGTDRVAYTYNKLNFKHNIIVNIQCDEPLLKPDLINSLVYNLHNSNADVATFVKKIKNFHELFNPSVVKVVLANDASALYFSRSAIPFFRDLKKEDWLFPQEHITANQSYWKHIGIYAYRKESLIKFTHLSQSDLEVTEKLEQLRLLQAGAKYLCIETEAELIGIDTAEDLYTIREMLK
jgi:3-deoxy-manno-octulosonate cytidylyltransferase (CMP-KDO synthetase)